MIKCKKCGAEMADNAQFCLNCGEALDKKPVRHPCSFCGTLNSKSAKFCRFCGRKLDLGEVTVKPAQSTAAKPVVKPAQKPAPVAAKPAIKPQEKPAQKPTPVVEKRQEPTPKVEPIYGEPVREEPVIVEPVIAEPVVVREEPVVVEPVREEPFFVREEPVFSEPIIAEPVAEPVVEQIAIDELDPQVYADEQPKVEDYPVIAVADEPILESEEPVEAAPRTKSDIRVDRLRITSKIIAGILMIVSVAMLLLSGISSTVNFTTLDTENIFSIINYQHLLDVIQSLQTGSHTLELLNIVRYAVLSLAGYGAMLALAILLIVGIIKFCLLKKNRYSYVGGVAMKMFIVSFAALAVISSVMSELTLGDGVEGMRLSNLTLILMAVGLLLFITYLFIRTAIRSREKLGGKGAVLNLCNYVGVIISIGILGLLALGSFMIKQDDGTLFSGYAYLIDMASVGESNATIMFIFSNALGDLISLLLAFTLIFTTSSLCTMISKGKSAVGGMVFSIFSLLIAICHFVVTFLVRKTFLEINTEGIVESVLSTNGIYVLVAAFAVLLLAILGVVINALIKRDRMKKVADIVLRS